MYRIIVLSACAVSLGSGAQADQLRPVIKCSDFVELHDGSWHVIKDTEIDTGSGGAPTRVYLKAGKIIPRLDSGVDAVDKNGHQLFESIDQACNASGRA